MRTRLVRLIAALLLAVAGPMLVTGCVPGTATVAKNIAHHADEGAEAAGRRAVAGAGELAAREAAEKAAREAAAKDAAEAAAKKTDAELIAAKQPLGRKHSGRYEPKNLDEKLAMDQVQSNPAAGMTIRDTLTTDKDIWPEDGWVKKAQNVDGLEIHYLYNTKSGAVDDFKYKN